MFVICDNNDVVVDIATEEANLSRGYNYGNYKLWVDVESDVLIGDSYDGTLIKNQALRDESAQKNQYEQKIAAKIRADAIAALIVAGDLPAGYK